MNVGQKEMVALERRLMSLNYELKATQKEVDEHWADIFYLLDDLKHSLEGVVDE